MIVTAFTPRIYAASTVRILRQLRRDHRTVAMILLVPALLMTLLYFLYVNVPTPPGQVPLFNRIAVTMLGILPFVVMFLITSIAMQRERSSGTLERLLTTPMTKLDLLGGYGTAFSLAAAAQAGVACLAFTTRDDPSDDLATKDRICWVSWLCLASIAPSLGSPGSPRLSHSSSPGPSPRSLGRCNRPP